MRIQNPNQVGAWSFHVKDIEGNDIVIPPYSTSSSIEELLSLVLKYIQEYDNVSNGEYSKTQRELAAKEGMSFEDYMKKLINHQMCLRNRGVIPCWSDGLGDNIHNLFDKVASFKKAPESTKTKIQNIISSFVPGFVIKGAGCASCGGSMVMSPTKDNLGRAGKLNK